MAQRTPLLEPTIDDFTRAYDRGGPFPISEADYVRLALDDYKTKWELHDGILVEKPLMSFTHVDVLDTLDHQLAQQLDFREYRILVNDGRLRREPGTYLIPDVSILPSETLRRLRRAQPEGLGVFDEPFLFVAEARSPSTGNYDVNVKIPVYKERGDREIWRIHPQQRTVTRWTRNDNGIYTETELTSGQVHLFALPHVVVDLDTLFDS